VPPYRHYVMMLQGQGAVSAPGAQEVSQRSEGMKEHVLATILSRSL
jgi:hypothetical protein